MHTLLKSYLVVPGVRVGPQESLFVVPGAYCDKQHVFHTTRTLYLIYTIHCIIGAIWPIQPTKT